MRCGHPSTSIGRARARETPSVISRPRVPRRLAAGTPVRRPAHETGFAFSSGVLRCPRFTDTLSQGHHRQDTGLANACQGEIWQTGRLQFRSGPFPVRCWRTPLVHGRPTRGLLRLRLRTPKDARAAWASYLQGRPCPDLSVVVRCGPRGQRPIFQGVQCGARTSGVRSSEWGVRSREFGVRHFAP